MTTAQRWEVTRHSRDAIGDTLFRPLFMLHWAD